MLLEYSSDIRAYSRRIREMPMKKIKTVLKLQIEAGKANPAPPIGPALGQHGVNIADFCKQFNDKTKDMTGDVVPAEITIYEDRSFSFVLKTPPASALIKKAAGIEKGAKTTPRDKAGKMTRRQLREIAERKMPDLNANELEAAEKIIAGTARSMGVDIIE
jgi:large subunit ribosomal protein L11